MLLKILTVTHLSLKKKINFKFMKEKLNGYEPKVMGIETRLEQVLANLLDNAVSFSPKNSDISINVMNNKENILIKVKDSGPGFNEENTEKIFKDFIVIDLKNLVNTQV